MVWNRNSCAERGVVPGMRHESRPETTGGVSQYSFFPAERFRRTNASAEQYICKYENVTLRKDRNTELWMSMCVCVCVCVCRARGAGGARGAAAPPLFWPIMLINLMY